MARIEGGKILSRKTGASTGTETAPQYQAAPSASVFERMSAPADVSYLRGVLFGPPGTGKTVSACSGEGRKLLVLTEPEGDLSLRGRTDIDVVRPTTWKELYEVVEAGHMSKRAEWDWFIFDSVTFMIELVGGKDIFRAAMDNKDVRRPFLKAGAAVNQIIHDAVALPTNVVFTAQMKVDSPNEEAGETPLNPEEGEYPLTLGITPMVYKILVPAVSFVGRTYKRQGFDKEVRPPKRVAEYWVSFEDFGRSPARTRIPVQEQVRNLNLSELLAAVKT